MNKVISKKNRVFISLVVPSETGESQILYKWLKLGTFQPKFAKFTFLINIRILFAMLCKKNRKF